MAFKTKSPAERLTHVYQGATIYYHRILYTRQSELRYLCTERGEVDEVKLKLLAAQEAVDGWDEQVLGADDLPLPMPTGATPEEWRERIAMVVATFPTELIVEMAILSFADTPETVRKNWQLLSSVNSGFLTVAQVESLRALIAALPAEKRDLLSLAIQAESTPASTGQE